MYWECLISLGREMAQTLTLNQRVVGSNPTAPTNLKKNWVESGHQSSPLALRAIESLQDTDCTRVAPGVLDKLLCNLGRRTL